MPQALTRPASIPKLNRFGWLMALYAENHARLTRLFAPAGLVQGRYVSRIGDGLDLYLDVIETHRYTVELRLTYGLRDPQTGEPTPPLSCAVSRRAPSRGHALLRRPRWQDAIGMYPPPAELIGHRSA